MKDVIPLIRWHHERCDGRGYPDGLRGGTLPSLVCMSSVADVYAAPSSRRPYRDAIPHRECLRLLCENASNGGLDPDLVQLFCESYRFPRAAVQDARATELLPHPRIEIEFENEKIT